MTTGIDRRVYLRVPVKVTAVIRKPAVDGTIYFISNDLSIGGIFLESEIFLTEGTVLHLSFAIPQSTTPCDVVGEVVRIQDEHTAKEPAGMGIRFLEISDPDRRRLEAYLESQPRA